MGYQIWFIPSHSLSGVWVCYKHLVLMRKKTMTIFHCQVSWTIIIFVFSWPCEWRFMEGFCKDWAVKILLPITLGHAQMVKGCDSSLKAEALSGLPYLSLLMVEWLLVTRPVTCTLYQPMVLSCFFSAWSSEGRKKKRKATKAEGMASETTLAYTSPSGLN